MPENSEPQSEEPQAEIDYTNEALNAIKRGVRKEEEQSAQSQKAELGDEIKGSREGLRLINKFFEKYGLIVPEDELPVVVKGKYPSHIWATDNEGKEFTMIQVEYGHQVLDGEIIGEEMSHFYRHRFEPNEDCDEKITNEFFGWLGRRMLYQAVSDDEKIATRLFPKGEPKIEDSFPGGKGGTIENLRKGRNGLRKATQDWIENKIILEVAYDRRAKINRKREIALHHYRGYEFASKIDFSQITDWKKLFSMSSMEVRKRFFTDKPDYSGL